MPITLDDLIERVRSSIDDRPNRDSLAAAVTDTTSTDVTLTSGENVSDGSLIDINLETMRVVSKSSTTEASVNRAIRASTASTHLIGAQVLSSFRFTRSEYQRAINDALSMISEGFGKVTWDDTGSFSTSTRMVAVPATALRLIGVFESPSSGYGGLLQVSTGGLMRVPTPIAASNKAASITGYNPSSGTAYVQYEIPWPSLTALTGTLDATYPLEGLDLIELGAQAALLLDESGKRAGFDQPHARSGVFVSTESSVRVTASGLHQRFLLRRNELAARIRPKNYAWLR